MNPVIFYLAKRLLPLCIFLAAYLVSFPLLAQDPKSTEDQMMKQANENIEKFRKSDVTIQFKTADGKPINNAKVSIDQVSHDFLFGCIIFDLIGNENSYRPDLFKARFKKVFNLAVFPFYWPGYEPKQGMIRWESMLPTLEWCQANGITTKGHPLVWATESGVPEWLTKYTVPESEELLKSRVLNIVSGFDDKIQMFDVVNEPVNVKTWDHKVQNPDDHNDWGVTDPIPGIADYVEKALDWAHEANPQARLIVNEYRTIADLSVRKRFDDLLTELKKRNAPFSGIGIQAHEPRQEWFSPVELWKTFDLYSKYNVPIFITEFHPQSSGVPITGNWRTGNWTPEVQAYYTKLFLTLCYGHPSVASVNWWGLSDRNIWLPGGGLIDENYEPKPVYNMLDSLVNITWRTSDTESTDTHGNINFRGFFGNYKISVTTAEGKTFSYEIHVAKNEENKWGFVVD
jgi:endo-1,4-beta-xylanase